MKNSNNPDIHNNSETEIKLKLTESVYNQLKKSGISKNKKVFQKNYFLDSSEHILLQHKWVLRIRIEDSRRGYITAKGPGEIQDAFHIRPEFESSIPPGQAESLLQGFDLSSIQLSPCTELINRFGNHHVVLFLHFTNLRISFPWKEWDFELDKTTIEETQFYELEVETDTAHKDVLEKELKDLFKAHNWDFIPSPVSKFKRALKLFQMREDRETF